MPRAPSSYRARAELTARYNLFVPAIVASLLLCTKPPFHEPAASVVLRAPETPGEHGTPPGALPPRAVPGPLPALLPGDWVGRSFTLIEKSRMFQQHGYHLYTSRLLSDDPAKADTSLSLANHRLRCDIFKGTTLTVTAVEPHGSGEHLVTFSVDTLNLSVFGLTVNGAIEALALTREIESARERWVGRVIYSRWRHINTYDSTLSRFTTHKVSMLEPLKVIHVRWGVVPLPPHSLWLVVEREDGRRGIVPARFSWTNVRRDKIRRTLPWYDAVLESDPKSQHDWEPHVWETIDRHSLLPGMTIEQAELSWGAPVRREARGSPEHGRITVLIYDEKRLTFHNDTLVSSVR